MPDVAAYLRRIGVLGTSETFSRDAFPCTLDTLRRLHAAHMMTVPYETFDIINGKSFTLELDEVYDKIVTRGRGGYCFELNGLFAWLLRELGYTVTEYFGRFLRGSEPGTVPMRRHRVLRVVTPDGDYTADVGVASGCPLYPLKLELATVQNDPNGIYRFVKDDFYGWVIEEFKHEAWEPYYAFTEEVQTPQDYEYANFYCQHSPNSFFRASAMCGIQTENGRRTLKDGEFRTFTPNGVETRIARDDAEYRALVKEHFGINLE
ncbi:MAG: arylamine N-acetyltransferase [Ruminococcaceae bacterium]|nr:arylamine N-acetyltransferase [Oscillospiraceae bacterium]